MTVISPYSLPPKREVRILLLENIHESAIELFGAEGFHVERVSSALPEAELLKRVVGVHVLGIRSKTQVTEAVLAEARSLVTLGCILHRHQSSRSAIGSVARRAGVQRTVQQHAQRR